MFFKLLKPSIFSILFLFLFTSCGIIFPKKNCWKITAVKKDSTYFPNPQLDYNPDGYQARLAMPDSEKLIKIWIKGDSNNVKAQVFNNENISITEILELTPPYYTSTIAIDREESDTIKVKFGRNSHINLQKSSDEKILSLRKAKAINEIDSTFSFLVYGCFQPFHVDEKGEPCFFTKSRIL